MGRGLLLIYYFFVSQKALKCRLSSRDAPKLSGFLYREWRCSLPCLTIPSALAILRPRSPLPCVLPQEGLRAPLSIHLINLGFPSHILSDSEEHSGPVPAFPGSL